MKYILLVILMMGFASALSVDFDCPDSVEVNGEFVCSLEVLDGNGVYDVKVGILDSEKTIVKIWDSDKNSWRSGYYYLKEFIGIGEEKDISLKIEAEGNFDGVLKLRKEGSTDVFDFEIEVIGGKVADGIKENVSENVEETSVKDKNTNIENLESISFVKNEDNNKIISLSGNVAKTSEPTTVYKSKNSKILDYLPYIFSLFLIVIIGVLLWDKF